MILLEWNNQREALLHSNLKHYFIIKFPQRAGALKDFVINILGPNDDITYFEYSKKNETKKMVQQLLEFN